MKAETTRRPSGRCSAEGWPATARSTSAIAACAAAPVPSDARSGITTIAKRGSTAWAASRRVSSRLPGLASEATSTSKVKPVMPAPSASRTSRSRLALA